MHAIRLTIRSLARTPLFTLTAVASLALGIGANTAIFSMMDRVLLRKLPVRSPEELVFLYDYGPRQGSISSDEQGSPFSYPAFREMQSTQTPFTGLAGTRSTAANLAYKGTAVSGSAHMVSGNYFQILGVGAAIGRLVGEEDDKTGGGHPVVVLAHAYWKSRFGADPSVLNQTFIVNGHPMTIVGVAQSGFVGEKPGTAPDVFVPISMKREMTPGWDGLKDRKDYWVTLFGRLKPGTTLEQADTAINVVFREQLEQDVALLGRPSQDFRQKFRAKKVVLKAGTYGRGNFREQGRNPLLLLGGMTVLVLLIACANVANLQLARAAARTREIAVRLAIGASRGQLIRQLLLESWLIAASGAVLGLAVAHWTIRGILAVAPPRSVGSGVLSAELDGRMLLFALSIAAITGLLFGLVPALQASKAQLTGALRDQSSQTTGSRSAGAFRKGLVTLQTAIALLLLISAGLFSKTLLNLSRIDLGIRTDHLVTLSVDPRLNGYTDPQVAQLYQRALQRFAAIPGVTLVSAARVGAITGSSSSGNITVEGYAPPNDDDADSHLNTIAPGYFRTLGVPLIRGRELTESDHASAPKVAIVNESFVKHFLAGREAIGARFARGAGDKIKLDITIVGVVKDAKYSDMKETPPRVYYTPYLQSPTQSAMHFYLRTGIHPEQILEPVRRALAELDANLPIRHIRTMDAQLDLNMGTERMLSVLTGSFAALATLLAALGLYGVLAFNVARRTREIGIRMALGANARHVRRLVVRDVLLMIGVGGVVGVGSAAAAGTLVESVLYQMKPWDPWIYSGAAGILGAIALLAAYIPARRATTVDPMVALRYE
jgi:putative ABC transport system permease protein